MIGEQYYSPIVVASLLTVHGPAERSDNHTQKSKSNPERSNIYNIMETNGKMN